MDKSKLNFVIDALMFLCLMAMAGLGFLMKYVLPSGRDAWAKYGSNLQLSWLGWDRHDWGDIHLYLAFTLLTLLVLHIILHWQPDPGPVPPGGPRSPAALPARPDLSAPQPVADLFPLPDHPGQ